MKVLHLFVTRHQAILVIINLGGFWSDCSLMVFRNNPTVLDLHQVKEVLRVGFTLKPQLVLFHGKYIDNMA